MDLGDAGRRFGGELGLDDATLSRVAAPSGPVPWTCALPVAALACDAVALASLALDEVAVTRGRGGPASVRVDRGLVAGWYGSERVLRIDGEQPAVWAPLSGFARAADGWVRTHANYPHHERALRRLLGLDAAADRTAFEAAVRERSATELEDEAGRVGAVVGAVRSSEQWRTHPQRLAVAAEPGIQRTSEPGAAPRPWKGSGAPMAGIRVLDLTRVLAGPVAARDLALAGADVLRVDSPGLPETGWIHLDTGQGKRSTLLDLGDPDDRAAFERLLAGADVVLTGYRPGALARFGLDPGDLAERHPGLVTAAVSAWGWHGPWAQRRGFDSIVQAVSGIAMRLSPDAETPGALPVQALDHSTGHLLAAGIALALREQRRSGGSPHVRMSLAATAEALQESAAPAERAGEPREVPVIAHRLPDGPPHTLAYAAPALGYPGAPRDYARSGGAWGVDPPEWVS